MKGEIVLSLEEYIYSEIKSAIFNKKIPLNSKLNEKELAEALEVSRTPIRSALKRLQHEKIVHCIPNKGSYIYQPSKKEIDDVFQLRMILETKAIELACQEITDESLEELEELTLKEEEEFKKGDYGKGIEYTSKFHQELMKYSNNQYMMSYNDELINITNVYLAFHDTAKKECPMSPREHRLIIETLKKRDVKEAVAAVENHFKSIEKHLTLENTEKSIVQLSDVLKPYSKYRD